MSSYFKSAMDRITADEAIKKKTVQYVQKNLSNAAALRRPTYKRPAFRHAIVTASVAVVLGVFALGCCAYYKTPVSYLSIDINPSIELGVNAFGKVVATTGYNEDGQQVLRDSVNVLNQSVTEAVKAIVTAASDDGFIASDGSTVLSVTSETDSQTTATGLVDDAKEGAEQAIKKAGKTAEVIKDNVALARRAEAIQLGITPGKLNLIQKLQKYDPTITVDQYKDAKVTEIQKKFAELKNQEKAEQKGNASSSKPSVGSDTGSAASSLQTASSVGNQNPQSAVGNKNSKAPAGKGSTKTYSSAVVTTSDEQSSQVSQAGNSNGTAKGKSAEHNSKK